MTPAIDLLRAIRTGRLHEVRAVLDAGAPVELLDGRGDPGLPLGVACFMGYADIVRELVQRGAKVNTADNSQPTSPLSMAIRGNRTEVVKILIELGAEVPPNRTETETRFSLPATAVKRLSAAADQLAALSPSAKVAVPPSMD